MKKELLQILCCPLCRSSLKEKKTFLRCTLCKRKYPLHEGIADFRVSRLHLFQFFRIRLLRIREFCRGKSWKEIFAYLFHERNSPHQIAMGASLGVFLSVIPSFVLGTILALFISWKRKYHLPATYLGTLIVNPFNGPFVYFMNYKVGAFLLGEEQELFPFQLSSFADMGFTLYLGAFLVALMSAFFVYSSVYLFVKGYRKFRRKE